MPQQNGWTPVTTNAEGWKPVDAPAATAPRKPAATEDYLKPEGSWMDSAKSFVTNFAHNVDPRPALEALYDVQKGVFGGDIDALTRTTDRAAALGSAQLEQFKKAKRDYQAGRYSEAVGHTMAGALPLLGPAAAAAGEQIGAGDVAGGAGAAAGLLAGVGGPSAVRAAAPAAIRMTGGMKNPNPVAAEAVAFGQRAGIPIDAATATGSSGLATVQKVVSDSMGGAGTAERFKAAQTQGLATVGEQLAARANTRPGGAGRPMTPESAGQGAMNAVSGRVAAETATADAAYGRLRAIEARQPIPVDLTAAKAALEPMYRTLAVGADIAPLQGAKATAARALARILEGPDVAGISEVDSALSDLKSLARDAADTPGAAAANQAVAQVHRAVMNAAAKAGPDALKALNEGRAATTAKYAATEVRDFLAGNTNEPVQAFGRVVARNDTNVARVRDLAKLIPDEMPNIGRAFLDDVMTTATAEGGFQHAAKIASTWEKLGAETKALMFDAAHVKDLNNFFRLAEKIAENPNPSGTARAMRAFNMATAAASYPIAKLLYSPTGVKLLTEGLVIPLQNPALAAAYTSRLTAALKGQAALTPAMAGEPQEPTPPTIGRR